MARPTGAGPAPGAAGAATVRASGAAGRPTLCAPGAASAATRGAAGTGGAAGPPTWWPRGAASPPRGGAVGRGGGLMPRRSRRAPPVRVYLDPDLDQLAGRVDLEGAEGARARTALDKAEQEQAPRL